MKTIRCSFPVLQRVGNKYRAILERTEEHPELGSPKPGQKTVTSEIRMIDFERGYLMTQNNIYYWKVKPRMNTSFDDLHPAV